MTFAEIIPGLLAGKKYRRKEYALRAFIYMQHETLCLKDEFGESSVLKIYKSTLENDTWEEVPLKLYDFAAALAHLEKGKMIKRGSCRYQNVRGNDPLFSVEDINAKDWILE